MSGYLIRSNQCLSCMDHGGELVPVHKQCLEALDEQHRELRDLARRMSDQVAEMAEGRIERNARIQDLEDQHRAAVEVLKRIADSPEDAALVLESACAYLSSEFKA